ncbi:lipid IV(A) 3-deoxy-D-manno-octulosonic acid transferase [Vibrio salilacus]|uniref:lipid IV(A) 3-deoxy-D-manno-octulosonic acid transferase n=1 Tax=Vibrio salilacus TaxID=1323749 RepID=UPI000C29D78A|nr:lipid IV(A) 3-deoxy-D-manno-octulosonic acid transferase [Vibrio salilacus]
MWIRWIYSALLALAAPFLLVSLYQKKPGKPSFGQRWREHWGITPKVDATNPLWIHSVSVGESIAVTPIIRELKARHPDLPIVVTTTTSTGAEQIAKLGDLVTHRYMPLDFTWCVRGFLKTINPSQMLIVETELWPNTLHTVAKAGIPITVINARLSERSCRRYQKFQSVFNLLAQNLTQVLCQYQSDAERFIRLGLNPKKVHVTGSVKFDIQVTEEQVQASKFLRAQLGENRPVWIAASTHQGEDEIVLEAHQSLLKSYPNSLLILVPRHPERFNDVASLCTAKGFMTHRRTSERQEFEHSQVYIGDTMGEMLVMLGAADICFMGGSLVGEKVGGHNLLEPAALAKPLLNGPCYYNFSEITQTLLKNNAVILCDDASEIHQQLVKLFDSPELAQQMGKCAHSVVKDNQGALAKTIELVM